jgi:cyclic pyranopterin phosphate synthase
VIIDKKGRSFRNLRVSLTAACNYACTYCVPNGKRLQKAKNELSAEALVRGVQYLMQTAGIDRLRITGGEPLLSKKFEPFLKEVMTFPLKDVSLTTNGQFLRDKSAAIIDSGIKRINVSLDTLNPLRFRQIARSGDLATVLEGIECMLDAGIQVKINTVPMRTQNGTDLLPLLDYCLERSIEIRFIELMRMGHLNHSNDFHANYMSMESILEIFAEKYEFERTSAPHDSTSVRFEIPGKGVFGIIANESEPFCSACSRLRLSSSGYLYGCLSSGNRHYIADLLDEPVHIALPHLQQLLVKSLADKQDFSFSGEVTVMKFIGG